MTQGGCKMSKSFPTFVSPISLCSHGPFLSIPWIQMEKMLIKIQKNPFLLPIQCHCKPASQVSVLTLQSLYVSHLPCYSHYPSWKKHLSTVDGATTEKHNWAQYRDEWMVGSLVPVNIICVITSACMAEAQPRNHIHTNNKNKLICLYLYISAYIHYVCNNSNQRKWGYRFETGRAWEMLEGEDGERKGKGEGDVTLFNWSVLKLNFQKN